MYGFLPDSDSLGTNGDYSELLENDKIIFIVDEKETADKLCKGKVSLILKGYPGYPQLSSSMKYFVFADSLFPKLYG